MGRLKTLDERLNKRQKRKKETKKVGDSQAVRPDTVNVASVGSNPTPPANTQKRIRQKV